MEIWNNNRDLGFYKNVLSELATAQAARGPEHTYLEQPTKTHGSQRPTEKSWQLHEGIKYEQQLRRGDEYDEMGATCERWAVGSVRRNRESRILGW